MTDRLYFSRNLDDEGAIVLKLVRPDDVLPARMVFSAGFVNHGGIEPVVEEMRRLRRDGEPFDHLCLLPSFARDGDELVFPFDTGPVRYRFVGYEVRDHANGYVVVDAEADGDTLIENRDALVYELVEG